MTVDEQIHGHAAYGPGETLKPFSYTPNPLGPEDIEIAITHSGICGSDIHTIDSCGGWSGGNFPLIVGHEIVGTCVAAGDNVTGITIGTRVGVGAQQWACLEKECRECNSGFEQLCPKMWWTYNSKRPDGTITHGGYADRIRVRHQLAFPIPDAIDSVSAAPLLCAGLTVFAPLAREKIGAGTEIGVVGIGGLGHLAIQFAAKMGATVTAISHSPKKQADAEKLGATKFVTGDDVPNHPRSLDVILVTGNGHGQDWNMYLGMLKPNGKVIIVALPEENISLVPHTLAFTQVGIVGSLIGSISEMKAMLAFAAEHNVRPMTDVMPLSQCNAAIERVRKGDVKYRIVMNTAQ
ncbi:hypothetical protein PhCBS80983_g00272 [Powellomyces hirtus]|uniref:Enoyl reductase (ER) domain-containing protein n=1 Tax=Powellomyces hirtus TaxID=109895 RepID=A0A507EGY7_9FUNG|nr:hypothetical protein PhCBS80983_g00272 [Powellomyces hirtus]